MSRLVLLLEEPSMKMLLDSLLPRLFPSLNFLCIAHEGKQDLERSIPRKLAGWREPQVSFLILRDNDGADCRNIKAKLSSLCSSTGKTDVTIRIVCQELEAWYFGEPMALATAYNKAHLSNLNQKAKYRNSDSIQSPSKELSFVLPEYQKISGARLMSGVLTRENNLSQSFQIFLKAIERHLFKEKLPS